MYSNLGETFETLGCYRVVDICEVRICESDFYFVAKDCGRSAQSGKVNVVDKLCDVLENLVGELQRGLALRGRNGSARSV